MTKEVTIEELGMIAERAGLVLGADEMQRLLPGVKRAQEQAAELRALIAQAEPAGIFIARDNDQKK
ncbi:MAG TPA: hypothetical protein VMT22_02575 [Terriglobales bacterium]|jgi:hypothetical protein|nr:hypothetical protein [Terriglobales bacterium]